MDVTEIERTLNAYIRPQTFPVAIRMVQDKSEIPPKAQSWRKRGIRITNCQALGLARRQGLTIALTREDDSCPLGRIVLGFEPPASFYAEGNCCSGMYTETREAGNRSETAIEKFPYGEYQAMLAAPLNRANFDPDVIAVYGTPAQVMRLVHGALYKNGGSLTGSTECRLDCSEVIVRTIRRDSCQYVLPCLGDRVYALVEEHEMIFTMPRSKVDEVLAGVKATHDAGLRYPLQPFSFFEVEFPLKYQKLIEIQEEEKRNNATIVG